MSSFRRSRSGRVVSDWSRALMIANNYAWQLNRRHRVRGVRVGRGWAWMVERTAGSGPQARRTEPATEGGSSRRDTPRDAVT